MTRSSKKETSGQARPRPTEEQQTAAVKFLLLGGAAGLALVLALNHVLDEGSKETLLWQCGRVLGVALFAWIGYAVGLGKGRVVAENLECLAIAVVMALILKHFLIEAYKIPTGSMQPAILGNKETGIFDRVLVNKYAYLIDEPRRYEVIVFKYPLDQSKNYIKRLIGLPGERVLIFNGDIHVAERLADGGFSPLHIARKPRSAREAVLKTVYPGGVVGGTFASRFETLRGTCREDGDQIVLGPDAMFGYGHGDESIRDAYLDGYDPDWGIEAPHDGLHEFGSENVSDLALRAEITPADGCREVRLVIAADGIVHRAILGVGAGAASRLESGYGAPGRDELEPVVPGGQVVVAEGPGVCLAPGEASDVAFLHVDQELILELDGEPVLTFGYEISYSIGPQEGGAVYPAPRTAENAVELEVRGAGAVLEDLTVQRDIHYTIPPGHGSRQQLDVPEDALLALGDNTQNSSDGRVWAAQTVTFRDGTRVWRDKNDPESDLREFVDTFGERHRTPFGEEPVVRDDFSDRFHFVPRRLLLGKAIAVFWPIYPHFRWKLIR